MKINENKSLWQWGYLACFFAILLIPVVNIPPWFYPAAFGQAMLFRIIFIIALVLFASEIILKKRSLTEITTKIKQAWLPITFFGLISLSYIVATLFSLQPHISFWGDPSRAGGTLNFLLLQIFALLAFLVIKKEDWKKVLTFAMIGGILVSCIAIAQQFSLINQDILISYAHRPPASLGNTDFLALYLLLLFFPALGFALGEKETLKKIFYSGSAIVFLLVLGLTISRAGFLGLAFGGFYFLFFYRKLQNKKLNVIKITIGIGLCLLAVSVIYYANSRTVFSPFIENTAILKKAFHRLSISTATQDARIAMWKNICIPMLSDVPITGYGPENFSIGFDKFYSPRALNFVNAPWWDRAHNFLFDTIFTIGWVGLAFYLIFYGILFYALQKIKKGIDTPAYLIMHSLQAVFIAYFANLLFNFDTFSTSLIFFLLIAFTFSLISQKNNEEKDWPQKAIPITTGLYIAIAIILVLATWCMWEYAIEPLIVNGDINYATNYRDCNQGIKKIEPTMTSNTFINSYARLQYAGILTKCIQANIPDSQKEIFAKKGIEVLEQAVAKESYYTRSWMYLSAYSTILLGLHPTDIDLQQKSDYYIKQANQLSPARPEILYEQAKRYINTKDFIKAEEIADTCIQIDPAKSNCYLYKATANIYLGNIASAKKNLVLAHERKFDGDWEGALNNMVKVTIKIIEKEPSNLENYKYLVNLYQELIKTHWGSFRYHASLAFAYNALGEKEKAAYHTLAVYYFSPESKKNVDAFLQQLGYSFAMPNDGQYHAIKAKEYYDKGNKVMATKEALLAIYILPKLQDIASEYVVDANF